MKFNLPRNIKFVLDTLISNGHDAYIVGGCVRDLLCGKEPHDYDITTSAMPKQTQSLFTKTVATGLKHGTVTVIVDDSPIEVTTFRTESIYNDSRHPESVNFVRDVKQDLARRDFTVNAICYNEKDGLIDIFDGVKDIKNQTLKAVGDAQTRFCEDALRILRLFRFAATLEFDIEKDTFDAAIKCAPLLKNISAERIFAELNKAACGNNIKVISPLLETMSLSDYYIANGNLDNINKLENDEFLRTFTLLFLTSTDFKKTLDTLKCSNSFKDYCTKMAYLVKRGITSDKKSIKHALNYADFVIVFDCIKYFEHILNLDVSKHKNAICEIKLYNEPYKISQLNITGQDLIALGFDGKEVGEKLHLLLDKVIENPNLNERDKLLKLICN